MIGAGYASRADNAWPLAAPTLPVATGAGTAHTGDPPSAASASASAGAIPARTLVSWLTGIPRRLGALLFVMGDAEAYWHGWQITSVHGGLGRRYRDPLFATLRLS